MSISIARKNLFHEKGRLAISLGGVAFSVMLILSLLALYQGWSQKMTRFIDETPADVWVMQKGTADMFHSVSLFPNETKQAIQDIEGVKGVHLLLGRSVAFNVGDTEAQLVIIGYDANSGIGGPPEVIEGKNAPNKGEIIVDEVFAKEKNVSIDDQLVISDKTFKISGISTGGNLVMFQYSFIPIQDARDLFKMQDISNYALVDFEDGADSGVVMAAIDEKFHGLQVRTSQEFAENNKKIITESFLPVIYILVIIGFIVGLTIISLTIYTTTIEKSREYGLLKALGASQKDLYVIIFEQAAYAGIIGYAVGLFLTYVFSLIAHEVEPAFLTYFRPQDIAFVFLITAAMILLSAFIPIKRLNSIDPAIVFKS